MKISEILNEKVISVGLECTDKDDAINKMVDLASNSGLMTDINKVRECVIEREKLVSTGVGKGFAIPHGKTDEIKGIVAAFAVFLEPVQFVFLIVGKESLLNAHIKLLSRISRLMNKDEFREKLEEAKTPQEVLKIFTEEEANSFEN